MKLIQAQYDYYMNQIGELNRKLSTDTYIIEKKYQTAYKSYHQQLLSLNKIMLRKCFTQARPPIGNEVTCILVLIPVKFIAIGRRYVHSITL